MSKNVFANGREVSSKASGNKSLAAMPDVCLTPPSPPAGPIPIPYPNFSKASDSSGGTRNVKIGGKEVGQKKKSFYKSSKGDEAATKSQGMGLVTHGIQGKTYFAAWSMDVKFEGENATRQLDLTTHNHQSDPPESASTTSSLAKASPPGGDPECAELDKKNDDTRQKLSVTKTGKPSTSKAIVGKTPQGEGTTVASMRSASGTTTAHNNHQAFNRCPNDLTSGGSDAVRSGAEPGPCGYTHPGKPGWAKQKSGHAEARLLDALGKTEPSSLVISIDWRPSSGGNSKMPCETCHELMCAAAAKPEDGGCGHEIELCDKNGKKQKLTEEHCPADPASYKALKTTMGEAK